MPLDSFCNTMENAELQRHLLAVDMPTVEAAVPTGNEFIQMICTRDTIVTLVEDQDEETTVTANPTIEDSSSSKGSYQKSA